MGNNYLRQSRDSRSVQRQAQQKSIQNKNLSDVLTLVDAENSQKTTKISLNDTEQTLQSQKPLPKMTKTPITVPKVVISDRLYNEEIETPLHYDHSFGEQ